MRMNLSASRYAGLARLDAKGRGERLIGRYDLRQLLVTEGAQGAWLLDADTHYFHTKTPVATH
jgi:bifunctional ADP-heptose synthase (sugar kinase/adenylyltransferase)